MRWLIFLLLIGCHAGSDVIKGGGPPCGDMTCNSNQVCFQDCCRSKTTPCYVRTLNNCETGGTEIPACNGVAPGCVCNKSNPLDCPQAPSCAQAIAPICIVLSTSTQEPGGICNDIELPSDGPCFNVANECDPNSETITCMCPP